MSSRIRRPEVVRIPLTRDDWIDVKKFLTAGETRRIFRRMIKSGVHGDQLDTPQVGMSKVVVYLLDWSFTDADDRPLVIRGASEDDIASVLDSLDTDAFAEVLRAVEAHEAATDEIREQEKKVHDGAMKFYPISPSPAPLDGDMNGLPSLTAMSIES